MAVTKINDPITLNNGSTIKNRFYKAAMSEQLGTKNHEPRDVLQRLYRRWSEGGSGILVTGNVIIDTEAVGEPRNVVLEDDRHLDKFRAWAEAGKVAGSQIWMQLNHQGKQIPAFMNKDVVGPSALPMSDELKGLFDIPRELSHEEILEIIRQFANSARLAKKAGFDGVQIHSAHGYLANQFLSPRHNQRNDAWGGNPEKRMKFVLEVYRAIRKEVGDDYSISIKLNSADFMKDGLSEQDSMQVIKALANEGINLIEISGGTYESPEMMKPTTKASTQKREAYFLEYAEHAKEFAGDAALVVTGGFRSVAGMNSALASGATDMIGTARPMALYPDMPNQMLANPEMKIELKEPTTGIDSLDLASTIGISWYEDQLHRMADGKEPAPNRNVWLSMLSTLSKMGIEAFRRRRG